MQLFYHGGDSKSATTIYDHHSLGTEIFRDWPEWQVIYRVMSFLSDETLRNMKRKRGYFCCCDIFGRAR